MVDYLPVRRRWPQIFTFPRKISEAGEPFNLGVAFKNVSDYAFDSLSVSLQSEIRTILKISLLFLIKKLLQPKDTVRLNIPLDTKPQEIILYSLSLILMECNLNKFNFNNFFITVSL